MTRELDPQLVEAVADGLRAHDESHGYYETSPEYYPPLAADAITSADAHRAPLVREAVAGLMSAQGNLIAAYYDEIPVRVDVVRRERDNARTHLLTLLGAQEGDDA